VLIREVRLEMPVTLERIQEILGRVALPSIYEDGGRFPSTGSTSRS